MTQVDQYRDVLRRIGELAASVDDASKSEENNNAGVTAGIHGVSGCCTPRYLPKRLLIKAAKYAQRANPVNAPVIGPLAALGVPDDPMQIAILLSKYWPAEDREFTVSFLEHPPDDLRDRIVGHLNAWSKSAGVSFRQTKGVGEVRISLRGSGYWSYLGTDIRFIPEDRPTMNLEGFSMDTPEEEFRRVVRHEAGHTLGFPHEHMRRELIDRLDPKKTYAFFLAYYGWDRKTVDAQVLTPLAESSLFGTPPDDTSIMCYQLPGSITRDGKPIRGGKDINVTDYKFAGRVYRPGAAAGTWTPSRATGEAGEVSLTARALPFMVDWDPGLDPDVKA